jgi:hypothetical protein
MLWPNTDVYCIDPAALTLYRNLFYSIYAESLNDEERQIYRKYEGKSIAQINKDLDNELIIESEKIKIIAKRYQVIRKLSSKYSYLVLCFKDIKSQIQSEINKLAKNNDVDVDVDVNVNDREQQNKNNITNNNNSKINNDVEEGKCCWDGGRWAKFNFVDNEQLINWSEIEHPRSDWTTFEFSCDIDNNNNNNNNNSNMVEDDSDGNDELAYRLGQQPQRNMPRIGYLYLIAGGYKNSPPYCKLGCSTATDNSFFSRKNHYWVGSNPRYCYRYDIRFYQINHYISLNYSRINVANPEYLHLYETMLFQILKNYRYINGDIDIRLQHLENTYLVKYKKTKEEEEEQEVKQGGEFFNL